MDESESEDDVAQAMGFSTFGGKPPAKRRKVKVDDASGANSTTLGIRQPKTANPSQSTSLEPEGINIGNIAFASSSSQATGSLSQAATDTPVDQNFPGKGSLQKKKKQAPPTGLAGFLSRGQSIPNTAPPVTAQPPAEDAVRRPPTHQSDHSTNEPRRQDPDAPHPVLSKSLEELNQQDFYELRRGVRGLDGEMIFFQQSFIEDPWARLRSSKKDETS